MDGIDLRYLKAFYYTAKYLSFSRAADHLNIAQSAASRQIKLLEEGLGREVIIRSSKKVLLTAEGEKLYLSTQSFFETTAAIFESEDKSEIKIGILQGLLKTWFRPILKDYLIENFYDEMVDSGWYEDVKSRGVEDVKLMRSIK